MTDAQDATTEYTMSDKPKKSVGQTLKDIEMEDGKKETRLAKLERWKNGFENDEGKNIPGVNDRIDKLFFLFHILWVSATVVGTVAGIIFTWLLNKI